MKSLVMACLAYPTGRHAGSGDQVREREQNG